MSTLSVAGLRNGSTLPEELRAVPDAAAEDEEVELPGQGESESVDEPCEPGAADAPGDEEAVAAGDGEDLEAPDGDEAYGNTTEEPGTAWRRIRFSVTDDDFERYTMQPALKSRERPGLEFRVAQEWILDEIERMNFTAERFDNYDGVMMYQYGPGRGRPMWAERIGKKYQWIALYRLIGLVEDNLALTSHRYGDTPDPPEGAPPALQAPGERSLDPTVLIRAKKTAQTTCWWSPVAEDFKPNLTEAEWLDDLRFPDSGKLLEVESPDGQRLLVLQTYPSWDTRVGDGYEEPRRHAWMQIHGYLVRNGQANKLWNWLREQDLHGRWMPEAPSWLMYLFSGEYPWSVQARRQLYGEYVEPLDEKVPVPVLPVGIDDTIPYEFDAYHSDSVSVVRPTRGFFEGTALQWDRLGGYTAGGRSVFRMPDFEGPGPEALLVDREWIERWLADNEMKLVWTVLSEKHFIPGSASGRHNLGYAVHSRAHRLVDGAIKSSAGKAKRFDPNKPDEDH